jgi:hypothetical protein
LSSSAGGGECFLAQVMCAEMHQWRAGDVWPAAKHSGRVRKFRGNVIAVLLPAGANDGDAGNGRSARAMPTIARTWQISSMVWTGLPSQ